MWRTNLISCLTAMTARTPASANPALSRAVMLRVLASLSPLTVDADLEHGGSGGLQLACTRDIQKKLTRDLTC